MRIRPMMVVLIAVSLTGVAFASGGASKPKQETPATETLTLTPEQEQTQLQAKNAADVKALTDGIRVLMDEINLNLGKGKRPFWAVVDAGVSRMRPVMMAAATTILGMIPLLMDAFFIAMAVTIMVGLLVATVLTLVVVPVLYTSLFRVPYEGDTPARAAA